MTNDPRNGSSNKPPSKDGQKSTSTQPKRDDRKGR